MRNIPLKVMKSLDNRKQQNAFRRLGSNSGLKDFSSNDYLGLASSEAIFQRSHEILTNTVGVRNGATGSRLLSGNHVLYPLTENILLKFHKTESALIFNSGYDANLGFFSSLPGRGDLILYDEFVHASIRDGISLSHAKALKFKHNDLEDLNRLAMRNAKGTDAEVYIVTESVFSMDGDHPHLEKLVEFAEDNNFFLIVDEAHALGVLGRKGTGLVQERSLEKRIFARIITFGKAIGAHGAAILGSNELRDYLVNFARSFIYTTALPPHSLATLIAVYEHLETASEIEKLQENIRLFKAEIERQKLQTFFIDSNSAIHSCIIPGNDRVKRISTKFQENGFDVKAILSPTVPSGKERLRFCLHSFNSEVEIKELLRLLGTFVI